jgi:hypothetical protein
MADFRTDISEADIEAMARDWTSPIGEAIADAVQMVADEAEIIAPVSLSGGSKYAPSGFMKANTRAAGNTHYDERGFVQGMVGAPLYPYNFIANPTSRKGFTWNRGKKTRRWADERYLEWAMRSALPFATFRGGL